MQTPFLLELWFDILRIVYKIFWASACGNAELFVIWLFTIYFKWADQHGKLNNFKALLENGLSHGDMHNVEVYGLQVL